MKEILFSALMLFCIQGWSDDKPFKNSESADKESSRHAYYHALNGSPSDSINIQDLVDESDRHDLQDYINEELSQNHDLYNIINKLDNDMLPEVGFFTWGFKVNAIHYRREYATFAKGVTNDSSRLVKILEDVPAIHEVSQNAIPHMEHIGAMISGGTWQPYSLPVARNHAAFAQARNIKYDFVLYSQSAESSDSKELMEWMEDIQPYWGKVFLLKKMLEDNRVDKNKWVVWIDDDIVINDFENGASHLDRIVDSFGVDACILTSRGYWYYQFSRYFDEDAVPNTGIIMVRNTDKCLNVVKYWLNYSNDPTLGKMSQLYTLHEQEALAKTKLFKDESGKMIRFVKNRTEDWNFNTFKRFSHARNEGEQTFQSDVDNYRAVAALANDSYVHHTGMIPLYRLALIAHTLQEVKSNYPLEQTEGQ